MGLKINGTRPESITCNGEPVFFVWTTTDGNDNKGIWAKKIDFEIIENEKGTIKVERLSSVTNEAPIGEIQTGKAYMGDYIKVTSTPYAGYVFVQNAIDTGIGKSYLSFDNGTEIGLSPSFVGKTGELKVMVSANFANAPKSWHNIFYSSKLLTTSSSTTSYTKSIFAVTGYKNLSATPELTRVHAILYRKKNNKSAEKIKEFSSKVLNIDYTDTTTKDHQYLKAVATGIQSEVKSKKVGLYTYSFYWKITSVDQYY